MRSTFHNIGLPLFVVLGLAIFWSGCTYSFSHRYETGSSSMMLRESAKFKWGGLHVNKPYNGPQNAQELMKAFDKDYDSGYSKIKASVFRKVAGKEITDYSSELTLSEIDERYPRAAWLQTLLDRGITIENFHAYSRYLLKRHTLVLLEDNPNLRQRKILDIPPTDDWESYKAAYIDKLVKDYDEQQKKKQKTAERTERTKAHIEHAEATVEYTRTRLGHATKQIEYIHETSVPLKAPSAPKAPNPPQEPIPPQAPSPPL